MITASIILDTRRETKNGFPLKIRIHDQIHPHRYINLKIYQANRELIRTPIIIQREYQLIKELEYCNVNNLDLEQSLNVFKKGIPVLNNLESRIMLLEIELQQLKLERSNTLISDFYNLYLKERLSEGTTVMTFKVGMNKFFNFLRTKGKNENSFFINDIDYELLKEYQVYCIDTKTSINSFKSYLAVLKLFYKDAQNRKSLNIKTENPFSNLNISSGKKIINRAIDMNDFKILVNINSDEFKLNEKLEQVIDLLKFQFLIGGHDFVELSHLKWIDIKDNRIIFQRFKNKHRGGGVIINNMLHPLALEIIEKHGTNKNERIFSFIPENVFNDRKYYNFLTGNLKFRLKKIKEICGLNFDITSKKMRYTFRTIGGNLMINQMILEKIMGHSNNSISMGYQGATPYEIQDAEHLKVIEAVFGE
ncbi:phage integrase SAM-like domain-containing protein [Algoriella sp.]|uniref:phage integrase SAM-like domain-containing protein n=1 Tax=Algoriella sp. TaxID=1872434 RepID=UPI001B19F58E|nr:phage integrase SAM-like domain-containing protein [Algoriella sp.]MBO6213746.1 phage integrase SAM-like domain-containing protein [Algoriella sp.]